MVYCRTVFKYNGLAAACRGLESAVPAPRSTARICTRARPSCYIRSVREVFERLMTIPAVGSITRSWKSGCEAFSLTSTRPSTTARSTGRRRARATRSSTRLCSNSTTNIDDLDRGGDEAPRCPRAGNTPETGRRTQTQSSGSRKG